MSRYLVSALLLISLGTLKMGIIGGVTGSASTRTGDESEESSSALVNQSPIVKGEPEEPSFIMVEVTGYSSRAEETDDTPFTTALGTKVRPGVVAANWLPLGAEIKIPDLFGDQVFVIEDRMNRKHPNRVDIWFPTANEALRFGIRQTRIEIL